MQPRIRRGPLYMAAACLAFTAMIALAKAARSELDSFEVAFWRGITAAPLAWLIVRQSGASMRVHNLPLMLARIGIGFAALIATFAAARSLPVADLSLITQLQPLLVAMGAPVFLGAGERADARIWLLLVLGLSGCALLLAPSLAIGATAGLIALLAAVFSAGAHLCVRALVRTDHPAALVLYFQLGIAVLSALFILMEHHALPILPPNHLWPHVLGVGITASLGQFFMTRAYAQSDSAAMIAAASYSTPVWSVLVDIAFFAITPGWNVLAGGLLIVLAGLLLVFGPATVANQAR